MDCSYPTWDFQCRDINCSRNVVVWKYYLIFLNCPTSNVSILFYIGLVKSFQWCFGKDILKAFCPATFLASITGQCVSSCGEAFNKACRIWSLTRYPAGHGIASFIFLQQGLSRRYNASTCPFVMMSPLVFTCSPFSWQPSQCYGDTLYDDDSYRQHFQMHFFSELLGSCVRISGCLKQILATIRT